MTLVYDNNWEELKQQMEKHDEMIITSLSEFVSDADELKEKLELCFAKGISLVIDQSIIRPREYIELLGILVNADFTREKSRIEAQRQGILKALELKKAGLGTYGRPSVEIPENFEEQIRKCRQKRLPLETYRKTIGIKKSTFYKYANQVK